MDSLEDKNKNNIPYKEIKINNLTKKIIYEQMDKCICNIKNKDNENITGFFALINYPDKLNLLPVLIIDGNILKDKNIIKNNKIEFSLNKDKKMYSILIDNDSRISYYNKRNDIAIIEIKMNDGLNIHSFLKIDYIIIQDSITKGYKNQPIYLLYFSNNEKAEYCLGKIETIYKNQYIFIHTCSNNFNSSFCPIINIKTNEIIGINKGNNNSNKVLRFGIFIKILINEFIKKTLIFKDIINNKKENKKDIEKNDKNDEITIIYRDNNYNINKFDKNIYRNEFGEDLSKNRIFGEKFVERNKNFCQIIINGKKSKLCSH
jgi:hypothetical protein